jgi:hypothetical protein
VLLPLALRAATALAATTAAVVLTGATPSIALSCMPHPDGTPESIASGTAVLASGRPFLEQYDYAVIGTVTGIRTDEREGSPTYGATEIDVEVTGVLGIDAAPASTTLRAADPGWMAGYPFELGAAYLIPVLARSEDGIVNFTHGCDPVGILDDPVAGAAALGALADGAGVPFATPGDTPPPGDPSASSSRPWFVPVTSAAAVGAAAVAVVVLRRRPLRAPTPAGGPEPELLGASAVGHGDEGVQGRGGPA